MKTTMIAALTSTMMLGASLAYGQIMPLPDPGYVPATPQMYGQPLPVTTAIHPAAPVCTKVKYVDLDEMHPCATTKLIRVMNPCYDPCDRCGCQPECVTIKICVPPCGCERIKVRSKGKRVCYDYGKYEVDVRVKNGYIEVDYQD